jgi:proteic killer suppression protein
MNITFADRRLEKLANDERKRVREMGKRRADIFNTRLVQIRFATTLEDVRYLSGRWHELKEDKKGLWACDLDHPYRLIFTCHEDPIPIDEHGRSIWTGIKGVEIIRIEDYH